MTTWFIVDVEADGPCPGMGSMTCFGAIRLDRELQTTFYGETAPLWNKFDPNLDRDMIGGITREQHKNFQDPYVTMNEFHEWIKTFTIDGFPVFVSDNVAFDWQWINLYLWRFVGRNIFGHSGRRIGDLYAGMQNNYRMATKWKKYRKTPHTHHPVDDARGNAEALLKFSEMGLILPL